MAYKFGRTNLKGVFAAGGCASTIKDLVPPCVGDGATIAIQAHLYISYILNSQFVGSNLAVKCPKSLGG